MELPDGFVFTTEYTVNKATTIDVTIDVEIDKSELVKCKHCKHCEYDAEIGLLCAIWNYSKTESDGWCYKGEKDGE